MLGLITAPDASDFLTVEQLPDPVPQPDEALVEVRAASINRGELRLVAQRRHGWRPGQDLAGLVVATAEDGSGPPLGSRVVAWADQGGWSQQVAVPTDRLAVLPDDVDLVAAATLPVAGVTALRVLRKGGQLLGRRVLITGAAGGVGRFAVELAARSGASVTAVARGAARADGLQELGAAEIAFSPAEAAGPFDLILESVGGASLSAMPPLLARAGVLVLYGNSSQEPSTLSFGDFMASPDARVEVFRVYESADPASRGEELARLVGLVSRGLLHPSVGLEVAFGEASTALRALRDRQVNGKAVLRFDDG